LEKVASIHFGTRHQWLTSPNALFLATILIGTIALHDQSAAICACFDKGVVCFAKTAKLEQKKQLLKENDKFRFRA
jgi:uncharacterized membrane protein SirB2